jgi:UDP-2,3-diacylglucosamine pyrophosphatase LpxH
MATLPHPLALRRLPVLLPDLARDAWRAIAHGSLDRIYRRAPLVRFDDASRLILLSDSHRGDNSRADAFRENASLFNQALAHYYSSGFTYIEVGDGDELWQNRRFSTVRRAHPQTFALLDRFHGDGRLHMLLGNHDIQGLNRRQMAKGDLIAREALVLQHARTCQRLFVTHGHQADATADQMHIISRLLVRRVWKRLLLLGVKEVHRPAPPEPRAPGLWDRIMEWLRAEFVDRLIEWAEENRRILICGHTHRPALAQVGAAPYFNTGNCVDPGVITGLEITHGAISQVRWVARSAADGDGVQRVERQVLTPPRPLLLYP